MKDERLSIDDLRDRLTVTVPQAGEAIGIGRNAAYRAAAAGQIPTLRLGRRIVVPVPKLLALLGIDERAPTAPPQAVRRPDGTSAA